MAATIGNVNRSIVAPGRERTGAAAVTRYAVYFAPDPESAWWRFGTEWLGRDAVSGEEAPQLRSSTWDPDEFASITAGPRLYGFHATLKSPFRLAPGYGVHDVFRQTVVLAGAQETFKLPALELAVLDGFVVLRPREGSPRLSALAAQCVSAFDNLRAPPGRAELQRRRAQGLTERQEQLLAEWGYPYVFDEYRFHLTLTDRLPADGLARVITALAPRMDALNREPLVVDALTVFAQQAEGAPFLAVRRCHFSGAVEAYRDA